MPILQRWYMWRTRRLLRAIGRRDLSVRTISNDFSRTSKPMSAEDQLRNALVIAEFRRDWDVPA
jgi:hypothetical protein